MNSPANQLWKCVQACNLVYDNDYRELAGLLGLETAVSVELDDHYCMVGQTAEENWIVFRGSQSWRDWAADLEADPSIHSPFPGLTHRGFTAVWGEMSGDIIKHLDESLPLQITGHSLGGALATLAAEAIGIDKRETLIFGSPPVGNADFAAAYKTPLLRFENGFDIVPHLMPFYKHVGERRQLGDVSFEHWPEAVIGAWKDHEIDSYVAAILGVAA